MDAEMHDQCGDLFEALQEFLDNYGELLERLIEPLAKQAGLEVRVAVFGLLAKDLLGPIYEIAHADSGLTLGDFELMFSICKILDPERFSQKDFLDEDDLSMLGTSCIDLEGRNVPLAILSHHDQEHGTHTSTILASLLYRFILPSLVLHKTSPASQSVATGLMEVLNAFIAANLGSSYDDKPDDPGDSVCKQCINGYRVLGVPECASDEEVREAYRDLAKVWHPDRFDGQERLSRKAEAQMKEINKAYGHLSSHRCEVKLPNEDADIVSAVHSASSQYTYTHPQPAEDLKYEPTSWRVTKVMGLIVLLTGTGILLWSRYSAPPVGDSFANPESRHVSEAPTGSVLPHPSATPELGDKPGRQVLWDYAHGQGLPEIAEDVKEQLRGVIGPITHHEGKLTFGPALAGAFYLGQASNSQTAYSVGLSWMELENRAHSQGDLCFIVIATKGHFEPYQADGACKILKVLHPRNSQADLVVGESSEMHQGVELTSLQIWSLANRSPVHLLDSGTSLVNNCQSSEAPTGTVADQLFYQDDGLGSIIILPRRHFYKPCDSNRPFEAIGMDTKDADTALSTLRLPDKIAPPPSDTP